MNLKKVSLKIESDDEKTLDINVVGPANVTAGDIMGDGDVTVLNPDSPICTVAEGTTFHAVLTADTGRGYTSADENKARKADMPIGVLPIDSIYTQLNVLIIKLKKLVLVNEMTTINLRSIFGLMVRSLLVRQQVYLLKF